MTVKKAKKLGATDAQRPIKRVETIVALMKQHGISELSIHGEDLTVKIFPYITRQEMKPLDAKEVGKLFRDPLLTPEEADEVLFWSSGGSGRTGKDGEPLQPPLTGQDMPFANGVGA